MTRNVSALATLRRRMLGLVGLGALLGFGGAPRRATAAPSVTLILGESNSPLPFLSGTPTELYAKSAPVLELTRAPNGRALRVEGGTGSTKGAYASAAISAKGGSATGKDNPTGGPGTVAHGGATDAGTGGPGAFLWGGAGSNAKGGPGLRATGGRGIVAEGGRRKVPGEVDQWGGEGIRAYGGLSAEPNTAEALNAGVIAWGGDSTGPEFEAGSGVYASGYRVGFEGPRELGAYGTGEATQHGIYGEGLDRESPAIYGRSNGWEPGVLGEASADGAVGVRAVNTSTGPGGYFYAAGDTAVVANGGSGGIVTDTETGPALAVACEQGVGVAGISTVQVGVRASGATGGGYFEAKLPGAIALMGQNAAALASGGPRGVFVDGDCVVTNGPKPAAVRTSRGLTLLYVVEATTSVFEDIGKVRLQAGRARVEIDPLFAETIETAEYQVQLTPRGDTRGVYVAARDARGFEIREQAGGTSAVDVNYRIVARRKGVKPEQRLATFTPAVPPARPVVARVVRPKIRPSTAKPPDFDPVRRDVPTRGGAGR
jgi:hypothetical protein